MSNLSLQAACSGIRKEFDLPPFSFDCEIDSRWGITEKDHVEINVAQLELGRRERLEALPHGWPDHNYLIMFRASKDCSGSISHWFLDETIKGISQRIANVFGTEVHYREDSRGVNLTGFMTVSPTSR